MSYVVFGDNQIEYEWFKGLSPLLETAVYNRIGPRGTNPPVIEELIKYDRPDIILLHDHRAVLVVEKTREVPTGHNVGQRMARLVRALEHGIVTIKFFPFDAKKHGAYAGICNLNARLLKAFERMADIHGVPLLAVNWPVDNYGELINDGTENDRMRLIVHSFLAASHEKDITAIKQQMAQMSTEYSTRVRRYPSYGGPPGESVKYMSTAQLLQQVDGTTVPPTMLEQFRSRELSLIYVMKMTPEACRREDPYTGTQFIYDYLWCRDGPEPTNKHTNLVLRFPFVSRSRWYEANPNNPSRKSSNWYLTASALWLSDGLDILR
jgi:hypothetical protein